MTILIVDDSKNSQLLITTLLKKSGYSDLLIAQSAQEALELLKLGEPETDPPVIDLILMDIVMPGINGIEACKIIKTDKHFSGVPVIIVTSMLDSESLQAAFNAGATDYIKKPIDTVEMITRVNAALSLKRETDLRKTREKEIAQIGAKIQQTLLYSDPPQDIKGIQISALTIPSHQIDGDFYDFFQHSDTCLDVIIADVMGKGVPAALLSTAVKTNFCRTINRLYSCDHNKTAPLPEDIVMNVHNIMTRRLIDLKAFVTLCYTRFDLLHQSFYIVDCGHTRTLHYHHETQTIDTIESAHMPLGFLETETYRPISGKLEKGDILFFYSDGITEARDAHGRFFGENRLIACLKKNASLHPQELINTLLAEIISFSESNIFHDDLTCIAVKIKDKDEISPAVHREIAITSDYNDLPGLRTFIREICTREKISGIEQNDILYIELAAHEIATNIIQHAYHEQPHKKINVTIDLFADKIVLTMTYKGKSFDPDSVPIPPLDGSQSTGFGLFMTQKAVDEFRYYQKENGIQCASIVKYAQTN